VETLPAGDSKLTAPPPVKPPIDLSILEQIDVRVGTIKSVSAIEGSDKLVALRVNFGDHARTIVAALKLERENPREIEGKQALFVVNLRPRTMRGVVSEGMLFDIGFADGIRPVLAVPESPVADGVRAG
jgi:tRNA-binding protein